MSLAILSHLRQKYRQYLFSVNIAHNQYYHYFRLININYILKIEKKLVTHDPRGLDPRPTRFGPTTHEFWTHDPRGLDPRPTSFGPTTHEVRTHDPRGHEPTRARDPRYPRGHETHAIYHTPSKMHLLKDVI